MHLPRQIWTCLSYLANILTLSVNNDPGHQRPLGGHYTHDRPPTDEQVNAKLAVDSEWLKFRPPSWRPTGKGLTEEFFCEYPSLKSSEWEFCSTPTNRSCWIRNKNNDTAYTIHTDYETILPPGMVRTINLTVSDGEINADGMKFTNGKIVNGQYPGPLIQSCWGDTLKINVKNNMQYNGTAIHWHGIRQLRTMHMDGVPGITQCPIAPGDSFQYKWVARQYGSAWYHSHYSVQYADGLLGPLTIYGPHSASWDEGKYPLIMNDWFHNSAYSVIHGNVPGYATVLLNGTGNITNYNYYQSNEGYKLPKPLSDDPTLVNKSSIPKPYMLHFEPVRPNPPKFPFQPPAKKYLLRLINAAFETGFVFSIDHHMLEVISADFVAIEPYFTTHLHIGIGQRYNVIVHARPEAYPNGLQPGQRKTFWIRTISSYCFNLEMPALHDYERTGILSYYDENGYDPLEFPTTTRWPQIEGDTNCRDELLGNLTPILKWNVGPPANADKSDRHDDSVAEIEGKKDKTPGERLDVVGKFMLTPKPKYMPDFPVALFSFERTTGYKNTFEPLQIDYIEPIFLHLNNTKGDGWDKSWAVVNETAGANGKRITGSDWIYLALGGRHPIKGGTGNLENTAGAHPIHFHGHDFAILQQEQNLPLNSTNIKINGSITDNPPRRDVVLLPASGFVVIAFKADNPGSWIMHCHIAFHASMGLAMQIMERQWDALDIWPDDDSAITEAKRVCGNWKEFKDDCTKHWPGYSKDFQCYPACRDKTKNTCKNLLYDDSENGMIFHQGLTVHIHSGGISKQDWLGTSNENALRYIFRRHTTYMSRIQ